MSPLFKLGVVVVILATTLTASAQSKSYRIYDEFSGRDGFTFVAFSKAMIDAVNLNIDEENKDDDNVEFWIDGDSKKVKECHVIVKDSEDNQFSCLVSFYGNFKVEDLVSFEKFSRKQVNKSN